jgi:hypothetical protein
MLPPLRLVENLTNKPEIFDSIGLGTYKKTDMILFKISSTGEPWLM